MKVTVVEKTALIVVRDASLELSAMPSVADRDYRDPLKRLAKTGVLFFIHQNEEPSTEIEIQFRDMPAEADVDRYQPVGGNFRLELLTGELVVSSYGAWLSGKASAAERISVAPGSYVLVPFTPPPIDPDGFDKRMRELVGEGEWRHYGFVNKLGCVGCLPIAIAAIALLIPVARPYWLYIALAAAACWIPRLMFSRTRRYKNIELQRTSLEERLRQPACVLQLQPLSNPNELIGGYIDTFNDYD